MSVAIDSERQAFLTAICEAPADDLPRLVFADYLQEQDSPDDRARGEFIRVQIARAEFEATCEPCSCYRPGRWKFNGSTGQFEPPGAIGATANGKMTPRCRGPHCRLVRIENRLLARHRNAWEQETLAEVRERHHSRPTDGTVEDFVARMREEGEQALWMWGSIFTYRRGFPVELKVPLTAFQGEPCRVCHGDPRRIFNSEVCSGCNSDLRLPPAAAWIFARCPIERVKLTDARPTSLQEFGGKVRWGFEMGTPTSGTTFVLPEAIFDLLPDAHFSPNRSRKWWYLQAMADACLSDATVALGRKLAGQPTDSAIRRATASLASSM